MRAQQDVRAQEAAKAPVENLDCGVPSDLTRLASPLTRTANRLASGESLKVVAIGSSSTAGAGASSPAHSYPSRLAIELAALFPKQQINVINHGANGEETPDMLARFDRDVIAEKPDLVIWQVGTNAVLRDRPLMPAGTQMHEGLAKLKAIGADVILVDLQFCPKVIVKAEADEMVNLISITAKKENVSVFRRFAVMKHWRQVARIPYEKFLSPDELHLNDWSYGCIAKLLAGSIAEASTRATQTAGAAH
ncbi:MAG TPA: SGNH/GDSL hydrolase family protein [Pseudorhodoplanes sp.]|nr:SGNH/GDSL hydrolase family protein [Pseudorhodoplanes sp.]